MSSKKKQIKHLKEAYILLHEAYCEVYHALVPIARREKTIRLLEKTNNDLRATNEILKDRLEDEEGNNRRLAALIQCQQEKISSFENARN